MNVPSVAQIEEAIDALATMDRMALVHDLREFKELGIDRKRKIRDKLVKMTDLERGYLLGLQTARTALSSMPNAVAAGVMI